MLYLHPFAVDNVHPNPQHHRLKEQQYEIRDRRAEIKFFLALHDKIIKSEIDSID